MNNYYHVSGYEYASRISRFHTSYVTFDFYSPMFTEIYWYRYTPYSWGVSIYDDWYYYGASVSNRPGEADTVALTGGDMTHGGEITHGWVTGGIHGTVPA